MALSATCVCYNHPDKRGDFKCFDCKPDSVVNLCPQCNIQVHSLDIFRAHKVEPIESKGPERRLSQDVTDIEKLIDVENDILQNVLTRLRYTEEEEKEMQSQLIQLQTATKRRISEIRDCETKIEKAINYLGKVSSMITHCSSPVNVSNTELPQDATKDPVLEHSEDSLREPFEQTSEEPLLETSEVLQRGPADRSIIELPDVLRGKDVFPVRVVGSLSRNGSFWISKISESEIESLRRLHNGIKNHFQKNGFGDKVDVKMGALCAVFNRHLKEFCRVRIENVLNPNTVRLCFVDLAITEDAPLSVLCRLPKAFEELPFQALECCLFPDLDTQLPYEAKWCFKDLTYNKVLMAAFEGQVTASNGHAAQHVTLVSCDEIPVCINSKVEATVEEQTLAKEDRPLQPRLEQDMHDTVTNEDVSRQQEEMGIKAGAMSVDGVDSLEAKQHVTAPVTVIAGNSNLDSHSVFSENDDAAQKKLTLRVEAAEFIPISSESDRMPSQASTQQRSNNVPGILHLPEESRTSITFSTPDRSYPRSAARLPVGCVDFATYNSILAKASLNLIAREELYKARFMLIRSDLKRIVEGMKYDIWCSSAHGNRRLNRVFNEQATKGDGGPVFLLFSGTKRNYFCGVARMKTAVDPNGICQLLNEPFKFGGKMVGRCEIEWIYTSNLYFDKVLTPDSGFRRSFLVDAGDCFEVPARLGQLILKTFDSDNYFSSILQVALESHQPFFMADQPGYSEPLWTPPEEQNSFVSSQENWDEEIEASLRSAGAAEPVQMDEKSPQQVEPEQEEKEEKDPLKAPVDTSNSETTSPSEVQLSDGDQIDSVSTGGQINLAELNAALRVVSQESASENMALSYQSVTQTGVSVCGTVDLQNENQDPVMDAPVSEESESSLLPVTLPNSQQMDFEESEIKEWQDNLEVTDLSTSIENADASVSSGDLSDWEATSPTKICTSEDTDIQAITGAEPTEISTATVATCENVDNESKSEGENGDNLQDSSTVSVDATTSENRAEIDLVSQNEEESCAVQIDVLHEGETDGEMVKQEGFPHAKGEDHPDLQLNSCWEFEGEQNAMMPVDSVSREEPHSCDVAETSDDVEAIRIEEVSNEQESVGTGGDHVEGESEGGEASPRENGGSSLALPSENRPSSPQAGDLHSREGHYNSSEDLLDYSHFPVEEGKEYTLLALENVSSGGTFWARLFRSHEEESVFVHLMKQIGTSVESSNETLAADEVHIYKQCCFRGPEGHWHRGLVESLLNNGEILVRLIDQGECWEVSIKDLKPLSDDFYLALPPQAFECSIFYEKGDNKKEKQRIHRLVRSYRKLRVLVKCFSSTTVEVQILSSPRD